MGPIPVSFTGSQMDFLGQRAAKQAGMAAVEYRIGSVSRYCYSVGMAKLAMLLVAKARKCSLRIYR